MPTIKIEIGENLRQVMDTFIDNYTGPCMGRAFCKAFGLDLSQYTKLLDKEVE